MIGTSWSFGVLGPMMELDSGVIKVRLGALFFLAFCLCVDVLISGSGVQIPLLDRLKLVFFGGVLILVLGVLGPMIGLDSGVIKVHLGALFFLAFCLGVDVLVSDSRVGHSLYI